MARQLTEEEIISIAEDYHFTPEKVRAAAKEVEWIDRILKEHPDLTLIGAVLTIVMDRARFYQ